MSDATEGAQCTGQLVLTFMELPGISEEALLNGSGSKTGLLRITEGGNNNEINTLGMIYSF